MKRTITPLNVFQGDIVEFAVPDFDPIRKFTIPVGTKARFIEWFDESGIMEAELLIPGKGIILTNPDIIVVEN